MCTSYVFVWCLFHPVEYDAISRLGIDSPQEYLTRRYGNQTTLLKLETCCVGQLVQTRVEAAIEEVQSSNSWVDIMVSPLVYHTLFHSSSSVIRVPCSLTVCLCSHMSHCLLPISYVPPLSLFLHQHVNLYFPVIVNFLNNICIHSSCFWTLIIEYVTTFASLLDNTSFAMHTC